MYCSSSWTRILNVQDIMKERTKETNKLKYLQRVFLPLPSPVLATIHSIIANDVPRTKDVGLPTKLRFIVWVFCILFANTWYSSNVVLMLTLSLRRWPDIEAALGDCTLFFDCCIVMLVRFPPPRQKTK